MTGKQKCEILRQIRMTIARRNGIEYPFEPCAHGSDCPGTCPACEAELQWLAEELVKHQPKWRTADSGAEYFYSIPGGYEGKTEGDV